ncbi:related to REX4-strong similarity to X.laevis XPMC2 protein [Sporisorium reilianum SRZ2]|uniref:RNA exonuclease 4 n=1 Tax=Sporisorium reilianum (strain SRZ2) TaxID=999809 RepID=E6ZU96_SPORE|nr:related to REX4-strong similarity to X.laevis XPMC2 protein [Sporisorium reilianum SRZ2]
MKRPATPTAGGAGSNWKALKKTLGSDASTSASSSNPHRKLSTSQPKQKRSKLNHIKDKDAGVTKSSSPAPTSLPWFAEDISPQDLELVRQSASDKMSRSGEWEGIMDANLKKKVILGGLPSDANPTKKEPGNYLAIDCEMVGVGDKGSESILARVSIVNFHGATIMDRFVRPQEKVTDYRTWVSGVRPQDLRNAPSFSEVQGEVANLIKGKVLVGHAIQNDLKALLLSHPKPLIRDTATFQPLRDLAKTKYPSLKKLAKLVLGIDIQLEGESHSSVEDARATMAVFRSQKPKWDEMLRSKRPSRGGAFAKLASRSSAANKVWKAPTNGEAVGAASPVLNKRSMSSSTGGGGALQDTVRLKPRMAAKADWWKESM